MTEIEVVITEKDEVDNQDESILKALFGVFRPSAFSLKVSEN